MHLLEDDPAVPGYRNDLMEFLNGFGLDAAAILSTARRTEPVSYEPHEVVIQQGAHDQYLYFLVHGTIAISLEQHGRVEVLGERQAVTLLGEISYFNHTPATATVAVNGNGPASFMRLSYDEFTDVLETYPQMKPTLARIGEMRVISQMDGFISYSRFMDLIGQKRDRLAVNRALFPYLEDTIALRLLPRLEPEARILEVGDGPGIICEVLHEHRPEGEDHLFLQATHLEDAILDPLTSFPSDFSRANYLRERFDAIVALQVFEHVKPSQIAVQFERAARLLHPGALLLVIRLRAVDVMHVSGKQDTSLFFEGLEGLLNRAWPGLLGGTELIHVSFMDADVDPMMEWSPEFCQTVIDRGLEPPANEQGVERLLLDVLLRQARARQFNPEEINFHWLAWHASHHGLTLEESSQNPEVGFYYQLYRRDQAGEA